MQAWQASIYLNYNYYVTEMFNIQLNVLFQISGKDEDRWKIEIPKLPCV